MKKPDENSSPAYIERYAMYAWRQARAAMKNALMFARLEEKKGGHTVDEFRRENAEAFAALAEPPYPKLARDEDYHAL